MSAIPLLVALLQYSPDQVCMAKTLYFEGRSEPIRSQALIAETVLERLRRPGYPKTICAVVQAGGSRVLFGCQYHWYCDGKSDIPREEAAWELSLALAQWMMTTPLESDAPTHFRRTESPDLWHFPTVAVSGDHTYSREPVVSP